MSSPLEVSAAERWLIEWHEVDGEDRCVITPVDDLIDHDPIGDCVCGPYVEHLAGKDWLYVHASLDGRELLEGG